ncbi:HNH endonuclease signature motif containing protein [Brevibacterium luteolum]|uniref:HNH endonuclease n=1 Tax=Brevibacterium luteolum TaxID=199591 RepID=A0A6G8KY85_9MICO|nr:HNH endonuclease signature motif containing protein [Brevibacterium luteolum]QIN29583.1 HNH endonuclease [Brevibacterium luteolum]
MVTTDTTETDETDTATGSATGADELGVRLSTIEGFPSLGVAGEDPDALVLAVKQAIAHVSQCQARLLALLDEVERSRIWEGWIGIRSLAHWVSFVCEVQVHTAREYLRVMRALRKLPEVASLFAVGRVSYSKVRAITRVADRIDRQRAAEIVVLATAEQLSKMVSTYSLLVKHDERQELISGDKDRFTILPNGQGRARILIDLPETEAAEILAAVGAAHDRLVREQAEAAREASAAGEPEVPENPSNVHADGFPTQAEALMELVRCGSDAANGSRTDAARATMVVHVSPDTLAQAQAQAQVYTQPVPDGAGDVPAGTSQPEQKSYVDGYGAISAESSARLACSSAIIGAALDRFGDVLVLGRTKRLASSRQRLALSVRDLGLCQFPGCGRRRRLEAHHRQPWSAGGPTDLDNLILLCRSHHIAVHEHHLRIARTDAPHSGAREGTTGFVFLTEDGRDVGRFETHLLLAPPGHTRDSFDWTPLEHPPEDLDEVTEVMSEPLNLTACPFEQLYGPDRVSTFGGGYGFNLAECVSWLFDVEKPQDDLGLAA